MKNKFMKKLSMCLLACTAFSLAGCDKEADNSNSNSIADSSSTVVDSSSETLENTFENGIDDATKVMLAKVASGDFSKVELASSTNSMIGEKYEVRKNGEVNCVVYKASKSTGFKTISYYFAVDTKSFLVNGVANNGSVTTHGQDGQFEGNDLGLVGTDGTTIDTVAGSTVTVETVNSMVKACVAQAKSDYTKQEVNDDAVSFVVRYDLNGGEGTFLATVVENGKLLVRPVTDPVKTDYDFIGWYVNDTKFDFSKPITDNVVLTAKWTSSYTFHNGIIYEAPEVKNGKVIIPSSIDGQIVTELSEKLYFNNEDLKEITIPATVNKINFSAFEGCSNLTKIIIGSNTNVDMSGSSETVTDLVFGISVFANCTSLKEVVIPERTATIGSYMFEGCTALTKATVKGFSSIPTSMFEGCTSLKNVVLGEGLKSLESDAFAGCTSLSEIQLPDSLTSVKQNAFANCTSLSSIEIAAGITSIGVGAFEGCINLSTITVDEKNTKYMALDNALYTKSGTNPTSLFYVAKSNVTNYEFPATVTSYDGAAFSAATQLKTFSVADGNTKFTVIDGVLYSQAGKYLDCVPASYTGSIAISSIVTSMNLSAFRGTKNITDVTVDSANTKFKVTDDGLLVNLVGSGTNIYSTSVYYVNKSATGEVTIPEKVTSICNNAFAYSKVTAIHLTNKTVPTIQANTFTGVIDGFKIYVPKGYTMAFTSSNTKTNWTDEVKSYITEEIDKVTE